MKRVTTVFCATALSLCFGTAAFAEDKADTKYNDTLSGNWKGIRTSLADKGVSIDITYKADVMSNVSGGIKTGSRALDNLDVVAAFDGEKLIGSKGTEAVLHFLNNNGGRPEDLVGSAQGVDNIEVPKATTKLYEAWVQQSLLDNKLSVLAGLYGLDSEFEVTETSGLFLHSTYGAGTDLSQSGRNGPPIFPFTAPAIRVKAQPTSQFYLQAALLDGVPGDPNNPKGTQIELHSSEGGLVIGEAGYTPAAGQKFALGGWYYTKKLPDQLATDTDGNPLQERSQGMYLLGELPVYKEQGTENQGLSAFARVGFADDRVNQFDYAWSAGVVYTGLIPNRDEGQLGAAISGAHNGRPYKEATVLAGGAADSSETAIEVTYSDNLTPWLTLQPDAQYIINTGTDPERSDAFVLGLRTTIKF